MKNILLVLALLFLTFNISCKNNATSPSNTEELLGPVNIELSLINRATIQLSWDSSEENIDGYKIDKKIGDTGQWIIEIADLDNTAKYWLDTQVSTNSVVYYRIYSFAGNMESEYSYLEFCFTPIFVHISGGNFQMGNNGETWSNPVHSVTVSSFKISKYEITTIQYCEFMNAIGVNLDGSYNNQPYIESNQIW